MTFSLNTTVIKPDENNKINSAIILLHGYGGDGNDISILANYWKNFLPSTLFLCPDAPEICKVNPAGFQWFDLMDQTDDEILSQSLIAENRLNKLIDEVKETNKFRSLAFLVDSIDYPDRFKFYWKRFIIWIYQQSIKL